MSRPLKTGLDYFPMDVEMDDKVELIEAKHGITGFGILVKLYQKIYKEGYFINVTEETLLLLSKRISVDINKVNEVINDCIKYDIFNEKLYKSFKILTSAGIQKRYLQAVDRRKDIELIEKFIIVDINGLNVNINWINTDIGTQSKVKESKVNKSIIYTDEFLIFWQAYPNAVSKKKSFEYWQKQKDKPDIEIILQKLEVHKKSDQWQKDNGQFIPMSTTYINQARWDDKKEVVKNKFQDTW
jgi:hypothetical protein